MGFYNIFVIFYASVVICSVENGFIYNKDIKSSPFFRNDSYDIIEDVQKDVKRNNVNNTGKKKAL